MNKVVKILVVVAIVLGVCGVWAWKNAEKLPQEEVDAIEENHSEVIIENDGVQEERLPVENEINEPPVIQEQQEETGAIQEVIKVEITKPPLVENVIEDKTIDVMQLPEIKPEDVLIEEPKEDSLMKIEEIVPLATPDLVATEFDLEKLKSYHLPMMIEFGASWCTWCRWMEPTLEELNQEFSGKVVIQSVDVEKFRNEVDGFDVSLLPTIYFFDVEGNVFETRVGAMTKEDILKVFESMGVVV